MWATRLERGRFISDWRRIYSRELAWTGFKLWLEGIEVGRQRVRFNREKLF